MRYKAQFEVDGTGNWSITLPADVDKHDVLALGPVIDGIKAFLLPTIDQPIDLVPVDDVTDLPDLIA